jgi:hypothetical protein
MEKNVLSEVDQIKYLFGYKAGKVISEQITTTDSVSQQGPEQTMVKTSDGKVVKFPFIKNQEDLDKFKSVTMMSQVVAAGFDTLPQIWSQIKTKYEELKNNGDIQGAGKVLSTGYVTKVIQAMANILELSAVLGMNGDTLKTTYGDRLLSFLDTRTPLAGYKWVDALGEDKDKFINSYVNLINGRIKSFGGDPTQFVGTTKKIG